MAKYAPEIIEAAKALWIKGHKAQEIQTQLNLNSRRIVYYWAEKGEWADLTDVLTPEQATAKRFNLVMAKDVKTANDIKELNALTGIMERQAKIKSIKVDKGKQGQKRLERDHKSQRTKKSKKSKNDISHITEEDLRKIRKELFFAYQHDWWENKHQRTRFILKSRQIGATYYMGFEAFEEAVLTGDSQIFLSASKNQAHIFKAYITAFAKKYFDVELKGGEEITLSNGAVLRFISTNASTSQGYSGHLYIDEVFWIPDFEKLNKVASAIASQKKWRKTYMSTPSVKQHGAYPLFSGEKFKKNARIKAKKNAEFDLSHAALKDGLVGADGIWRQIVTIFDAQDKGCDLFDIEQLQDEYSNSEFKNLFLCHFLDEGGSVFKMMDLINCGVDVSLLWRDYIKDADRPLGDRPVWVGYDPARFGDLSTVVVIAPPMKAGQSFRVIEKFQVNGSYSHQAAQIRPLLEKYNVEYIGVDRTGPGQGVFEQVQAYFPKADGIWYSNEKKAKLVLKCQSVIEQRQMEWDVEDNDLPQSFVQIKQITTSGGQITYMADRTSKTGHADYACAVMNAMANEPLTTGHKKKSSYDFQDEAA